jgi:hypothetical protein
MAENTIIQQGLFTATGNDTVIPLRNSADWVEVVNLTQMNAATQWAAHTFFWQYGMAQGDATCEYHAAATQASSKSTCAVGFNGAVYRGISTYDQSLQTLGAPIAVTAVTAANPPLVNTGTTTGLVANQSIVRLSSLTTGPQMASIDYSIGAVVAGVSFALAHMPQPAAGGVGFYRVVNFNPMFYPRRRWITGITAAAQAVVRTSVTHSFNLGEKVRFIVPAAFGMTQMNGLTGTVVARNIAGTTGNNTLTVDIDSSTFTAFAFPLAAAVPFTYAEVVPVGEDTASALSLGTNILAGATENQGTTGIILGTDNVTAAIALGSAGGTAGDIIKWRAGTSFNKTVATL